MDNDLKKYRTERGLTQEDLAKSVGVTRQTINSIERGRYNPSLELAFKLAHQFDCSIEEIFHSDPTSDDQ
nr:helix-turn-helix transcriptional regulator [Halocatena marina]